MKAKKIERSEVKDLLIASLPSRPTAPKSLGGKGFGSREMKEAFDKLPLYIIERYNELINDVSELGEDSLAAAIPSGIKDGHTLADLMNDVKSGTLAYYLTFLDKSLFEHVEDIKRELCEVKARLDTLEKKEGNA